MDKILYSIFGILIPFFGSTIGSAFVFFMKKNITSNYKKILTGFASGVMIAACIWSLILPSIEMAEKQGKISWLPASAGFGIGIIFLCIINFFAGKFEKSKEIDMLLFSVTLHNIPEGMAVGVVFSGFLAGNAGIALIEAIILAIGIAVQNIPESAIISMPLKLKGKSKKESFLIGVLSGATEPVAAIITILLTNIVVPILPYLLTFSAGAMMFVVIEELIPQMHEGEKDKTGIIWFGIGFLIMMILDICLG